MAGECFCCCFFLIFPFFHPLPELQKTNAENFRTSFEGPWVVLDPPKSADTEPLIAACDLGHQCSIPLRWLQSIQLYWVQPDEESCWDLARRSGATLCCGPLNKDPLWNLLHLSWSLWCDNPWPQSPHAHRGHSKGQQGSDTHQGKFMGTLQQPTEVPGNITQCGPRSCQAHSTLAGTALPTASCTSNSARDLHQWGHLNKTLHLCIPTDCKFWGPWEQGKL
jgi:hypothetical protein